jgi:type VI secretion system protein ImpE
VHQRDALMLSRLTRWQDVGETGVFALGQKTLMSDGVDYPFLDLREIFLGPES